ncbi:MAG: nucleotidyltransferase family protein, partial [Candidatus Omnitrophica bacterium]|nr:nucleotidyltransferase family protein [Candidatus Omnitrophota bacterium]
ALIESVYPDIAGREIADIDLLIKKKDFSRASQIIQTSGYVLDKGTTFPTYVKNGKVAITVELHTGIAYAKENDIWNDPFPISIEKETAYTLSLEENLIYLCYHSAVYHLNCEKRWLEDIHRLISCYQDKIDWDILAGKIKGYRLSIPCAYVFTKVKKIFATRIPDDFLSAIGPVPSFKNRIFNRILENGDGLRSSYALQILLDPGLIFSYVFPSRESLCLYYNISSPLVYLYYFIRPAHLALRALRQVHN